MRSSGSQRVVVLMQTDQKWQANCEQRTHGPEAHSQRSLSAWLLHKAPTRLYAGWQQVGCRQAALKQSEASMLAEIQPESMFLSSGSTELTVKLFVGLLFGSEIKKKHQIKLKTSVFVRFASGHITIQYC